MTFPTVAVVTTNLDASSDSPASARSDLLDAVQKLNQMIAHVSAFAATLMDDADAATGRTTLDVPKRDGTDATGNWAINASGLHTTNYVMVEESGVLYLKYGTTKILSIDSSGNVKALANVAAYQTV